MSTGGKHRRSASTYHLPERVHCSIFGVFMRNENATRRDTTLKIVYLQCSVPTVFGYNFSESCDALVVQRDSCDNRNYT